MLGRTNGTPWLRTAVSGGQLLVVDLFFICALWSSVTYLLCDGGLSPVLQGRCISIYLFILTRPIDPNLFQSSLVNRKINLVSPNQYVSKGKVWLSFDDFLLCLRGIYHFCSWALIHSIFWFAKMNSWRYSNAVWNAIFTVDRRAWKVDSLYEWKNWFVRYSQIYWAIFDFCLLSKIMFRGAPKMVNQGGASLISLLCPSGKIVPGRHWLQSPSFLSKPIHIHSQLTYKQLHFPFQPQVA